MGLGPECDKPLLDTLFEVKYAGLSDPSSRERLFENARILASRIEIPAPVLDFLFENSRFSAMGRSAWESDVKTAFGIQHLTQDVGLTLDQSASMMDPVKLAEVLSALEANGPAIVMLVHAAFLHASAVLELIDREISKARFLGGGYDRPPDWIPIHTDHRAALFASLKVLQQGRLLFTTPDGQTGRLPNTVPLLGKQLPIGDSSAFLAYEIDCPTMFLTVSLGDACFIPSIVEGPRRERGETFRDFRTRLYSFYGEQLNAYFSGHPRDLYFAMRWPKVFLDRQAE